MAKKKSYDEDFKKMNYRECKIRCVKWSTNFAKPYFF